MKYARAFVAAVLSIVFFSAGVHAQNTQNFVINSFTANYELSRNTAGVSQFGVNEYIQAQFPNYDQNHGILRALPQTYNGKTLKLAVSSVNKQANNIDTNTTPWDYTISTQNGNEVLKIGSANTYVQGVQNFHIAYTMQNVTRNYDTYDELFWNVNGTEWQQPMLAVKATVHIPSDLAPALDTTKEPLCYTGARGSTERNCTIARQDKPDGSVDIITSANAPLSAQQNMSFAIAFKPGTFTMLKPSLFERLLPYAAALIAVSVIMLVGIFCITKWRKYGRDPKGRGTIVAEYQPPKDTTLLTHEYILNEKGRAVAITATIISLAVRGYIRIIDTEKDGLLSKKHSFSLEQTKEFSDLPTDERQVTSMLFGAASNVGSIVELDDLQNKLATETKNLWDTVGSQTVTNGYFAADPKKVTGKYIAAAVVFFVLCFGAIMLGGIFGFILCAGFAISGAILLLTARYMPARTSKGVELHDYLLGLKLYINTAEKDRIAFHQGVDTAQREPINLNDPAQKVKLFEQLLPYAMIFGLEKDWGKQFANIYTAPPAWYGGTMNNFTTGYLLGSLGDFSHSAATSFSPPSSSGGSGFSGGFSGGGGGGGGGGGW